MVTDLSKTTLEQKLSLVGFVLFYLAVMGTIGLVSIASYRYLVLFILFPMALIGLVLTAIGRHGHIPTNEE